MHACYYHSRDVIQLLLANRYSANFLKPALHKFNFVTAIIYEGSHVSPPLRFVKLLLQPPSYRLAGVYLNATPYDSTAFIVSN